MLSRLYGPAGGAVSLAYLEGDGTLREQRIVRAQRDGRVILDPALPPFFVEFEGWRLERCSIQRLLAAYPRAFPSGNGFIAGHARPYRGSAW